MKPEPGLVSMDVAKSIICKVTGAELQDFEIDDNPELEVDPAILSLYLSELYDKRGENNNQISAYLVENSGADIILKFYEKTISAISSDSIAFLEKRLVTKEKRRDSIYIDQALRHGVKGDEIDYLVDQRLLHEYAWRDGKRIEFVHDVLCPIIYDRMEEREKAEEQRKRDKLLIQAQQEKKRLRRVLLGTLFTLLFCSFLIWDGLFDEKKILYREIIKKESWMAGLDKMSAKDAEALPFHYVFYKKGRWAEHPFMIEARNGYGELTSEHGMSTYLVNHFDDTDKSADKDIVERLRTVVKWELLRDADGDFCVQERAFDKDGKVIFCYNKSLNAFGVLYMGFSVICIVLACLISFSGTFFLDTIVKKKDLRALKNILSWVAASLISPAASFAVLYLIKGSPSIIFSQCKIYPTVFSVILQRNKAIKHRKTALLSFVCHACSSHLRGSRFQLQSHSKR